MKTILAEFAVLAYGPQPISNRYCTQLRIVKIILFLTICQQRCRLLLHILSVLPVVGRLIGFSGCVDVLLAQEARLVG
jgi:hypothetical protein